MIVSKPEFDVDILLVCSETEFESVEVFLLIPEAFGSVDADLCLCWYNLFLFFLLNKWIILLSVNRTRLNPFTIILPGTEDEILNSIWDSCIGNKLHFSSLYIRPSISSLLMILLLFFSFVLSSFALSSFALVSISFSFSFSFFSGTKSHNNLIEDISKLTNKGFLIMNFIYNFWFIFPLNCLLE